MALASVRAGPASSLRDVGMLRPQDHQPHGQLVGHVAAGLRRDVHAGEIAALAVAPQATLQLRPDTSSLSSCAARSWARRVTLGWVLYQ